MNLAVNFLNSSSSASQINHIELARRNGTDFYANKRIGDPTNASEFSEIKIPHYYSRALGENKSFFSDARSSLGGPSCTTGFTRLPSDYSSCDDSHENQYPLGGCIPLWRLGLGILIVCNGYWFISRCYRSPWWVVGGIASMVSGVFLCCAPWGKVNCQTGQHYCRDYDTFHSLVNVSQKDLTTHSLCNTVSGMANVLSKDKQIAVIGALAEGSSIRSIERMTGVHRDTVMRLGVRVGQGR